jgi:hypothetical protein
MQRLFNICAKPELRHIAHVLRLFTRVLRVFTDCADAFKEKKQDGAEAVLFHLRMKAGFYLAPAAFVRATPPLTVISSTTHLALPNFSVTNST